MSLAFRIILFVFSVLAGIYVTKKLKKSQLGLMDSLFWIILAFVFIILSIFPNVAIWGADVLGITSPVNFIYLIIIALLLLRCFLLTIKVSNLEDKLNSLVEELGVRDNMNRNQKNKDI